MPAETIDEMLERIDKLIAVTPLRSYGESETGNTQRGRWLAICDALCEVYPALAAAYRAQGEEVGTSATGGISRRKFSIMAIGELFTAAVKLETPAFRFPRGSEILTGDSFRHAVYYGNDPLGRFRPGMILAVYDIRGYVKTVTVTKEVSRPNTTLPLSQSG